LKLLPSPRLRAHSPRRPPRGGRGLKCHDRHHFSDHRGSPSSRRAWIEIVHGVRAQPVPTSPSSRRAWIEIVTLAALAREQPSRPPRGGRGLKFFMLHFWCTVKTSPSSRRAWIEIAPRAQDCRTTRTSPSSRRAWIEILGWFSSSPYVLSPSSRRAWIEMFDALAPWNGRRLSPSSRRAWIEIVQDALDIV